MEKNNETSNRGSALFQIFLMGLFSVGLILVLTIPVGGFISTDEYPNITPITPQKIVSFGGSPTDIYIGMYIRDLPEFDTVKGLFTIDLTIWFKFDPSLISLDRISEFTFDSAQVEYKSKAYTRIDNGKLIAHYDMRVKFTSQLSYSNFPFDDHTISFSLTHNFLSPSEAIFKSSKHNLVINPRIEIAGWKIIGKKIKTGYIEDTLDPNNPKAQRFHPRIIFSIDFVREGIRHIVTILIPLILIFFIALVTLVLDPKDGGSIIGISTGMVSAVIAHRFVIASISPASGSFMLSDKIFFLFLATCFTIFFINIFSKKIKGSTKNIISFLLYAITFLMLIYIFKPLF